MLRPLTRDPARRPLREVNHEGVEPVYRALARLEGALLPRLIGTQWSGAAHLPPSGGVIVAANHISYVDPVVLEWFLVWSGRWPRFLAKADFFSMPVLGWLARSTRQIPVYRNTDRAGDALVAAEAALAGGECVAMYPEGTVTRDPGLWPMTPRLGAARLALRTGAPVLPAGQWGAQDIMAPPRLAALRLFPRRTVQVKLGAPVGLDDLRPAPGQAPTREHERAASARIMDAIGALVGELRGQAPPEGRWDPRLGERVAPGG